MTRRQAAPVPGGGDDLTSALPLYRLAYEESKRALEDQVDELNGIRSRGVQFLAFVGAATAFLAGVGLKTGSTARSFGFYVPAIVASAISLASILCVGMLLIPRKSVSFSFNMSSKILIDDWIDSQVPLPSEEKLLKALAVENDESREENDTTMAGLKRWYVASILLGSSAVIAWAILAWLGGAAS